MTTIKPRSCSDSPAATIAKAPHILRIITFYKPKLAQNAMFPSPGVGGEPRAKYIAHPTLILQKFILTPVHIVHIVCLHAQMDKTDNMDTPFFIFFQLWLSWL